jgi:hypothetical protein
VVILIESILSWQANSATRVKSGTVFTGGTGLTAIALTFAIGSDTCQARPPRQPRASRIYVIRELAARSDPPDEPTERIAERRLPDAVARWDGPMFSPTARHRLGQQTHRVAGLCWVPLLATAVPFPPAAGGGGGWA